MKKKDQKKAILRELFIVIVSILIALISTVIAFKLAYMERGYFALGGEMFVGPMDYFITHWIIEKIFVYLDEREDYYNSIDLKTTSIYKKAIKKP